MAGDEGQATGELAALHIALHPGAEAGEALMVSTFSLIIHPALSWVLAGPVLGLEREFVQAAVILAAMPAGINGYIFATMYNRAGGTAASSALLATALSVLTVTGWLAFLGTIYP